MGSTEAMARHLFPHDLIRAQQQWHDTYRALAEPRPRRTTELRRRLLLLSVRIHWHPYWTTPEGRTPAARVELRQRAAESRTRGEA
ncbi:hypothetical protein ACFYM7_15985 [Streptomyces cyaneofuscatus]|uniref:hypothetical protein n=1 Tax=Streptomyces cyaneofuscatus TaxID=66883 RepID=UPI00369AF367